MSSYDVYIGHGLGQTIDNIVETEDGIITLDINGGKKEEESRHFLDDLCIGRDTDIETTDIRDQETDQLCAKENGYDQI